jgi:hypothetical protein
MAFTSFFRALNEIECFAEEGDDAEVLPERRLRLRVASDEPVAKLREAVRDPDALPIDDDVIEALRVEPDERHLVREPEGVEEGVDALPFPAIEDVVNLGAEPVVLDPKGVGVPAGHVMRLEEEDPPAGMGAERTDGETSHPGSDHEVVEVSAVGHETSRVSASCRRGQSGRRSRSPCASRGGPAKAG